MTDTATFVPDDPDDEILAEFILEIERSGADQVDLDHWSEQHPHLKERLRDALQMHKALEVSLPDSDAPLPERLGEFRIVRRIARGGMGDIFEAVQDRLDRRVAVKTIRHGRLSPNLQHRFLREQRILGRFHHTHIVSVHTSGQEGPLQYFAMPYIEGAALNNVVQLLSDLHSSTSESQSPSLGALARLATGDTADGEGETVTHLGDVPLQQIAAATDGHPHARRSLSVAYLRSVAKVMADVADAVQHAHDQQPPILHRDIKPSNIMVDTAEQCWIIDFGLAGYVADSDQPTSPESIEEGAEPLTSATGAVGTPQYMAPEQFDGDPDVRTDVWGLGATLYELLTLRRAFTSDSFQSVRQQITQTSPPRPRELIPRLPRDLDAICRKALRKAPADRYPSASEFAQDLRRWLNDEPTLARPARAPRRVWKWARRNRGWATTIGVAFLAGVTIAIGAISFQKQRRLDAQENARIAEEGKRVALRSERESRRDAAIQEMQRVRLTDHFAGWSEQAWDLAADAAIIRRDDQLRDEAAATLIGLDATLTKQFDFGASSLAFAPETSDLLMGAFGGDAKLWDGAISGPVGSGNAGPGPVAFAADGTPVQLTALTRTSLQLWDVETRQPIREFEFSDAVVGAPDGPMTSETLLAIDADATVIAALTMQADQSHVLAVWDAATGARLHEFPFEGTALALSPDGNLVAAGGPDGDVVVWSVETSEELVRFDAGRNQVHCLTFGVNLRHRRDGELETVLSVWQLGAGDAGGEVTIWDLGAKSVRSICYGSHYDVYSIAFSPDGSLLATGGRSRPRIWDTATGRLLLELDNADFCQAVTFSADGNQLALSAGLNHRTEKTDVWELQPGRGIRTLRGLTSQVSKVTASPNGRMLAAISHSWELGVWDLETSMLLHILYSPRGLVADNVAIAFSPDGERLAVSTGSAADLWNLQDERLLKTWDLPPGLADVMAFHPDGPLLLFRVECQDGVTAPFSNAPPNEYPRVCRIRNLLADDPLDPIAEINDFPWHVHSAMVGPNAQYFVVHGLQTVVPGEKRKQIGSIQSFDALTGVAIWSMATTEQWWLTLGCNGTLSANKNGTKEARLLAMPSGTARGNLHLAPSALTEGAEVFVTRGGQASTGLRHGASMFRKGAAAPFVTLGIDTPLQVFFPHLSPSGERLIWGTTDGTVLVCELPEIQRRLAELRLGW